MNPFDIVTTARHIRKGDRVSGISGAHLPVVRVEDDPTHNRMRVWFAGVPSYAWMAVPYEQKVGIVRRDEN